MAEPLWWKYAPGADTTDIRTFWFRCHDRATLLRLAEGLCMWTAELRAGWQAADDSAVDVMRLAVRKASAKYAGWLTAASSSRTPPMADEDLAAKKKYGMAVITAALVCEETRLLAIWSFLTPDVVAKAYEGYARQKGEAK